MILEPALKKSEMKELGERAFGFTLSALLLVICGVRWFLGHPLIVPLVAVATALSLLAAFYPQLLIPVKRVWMLFAKRMAAVVNWILMAIAFYGIVTPVALFFRLRHRDRMQKKRDPQMKSYWHIRTDTEKSMDMRWQF